MKKSKIISLVLAGALAVTAMLTGTFAWQAISQEALNEKMTIVNAGGRLHDDFNGTNKDIYVENFTDPLNNGTPIYARIRLDEYMEVGEDAGQNLDDTNREATSKIEDADIKDKTTWRTYIPEPGNPAEPKAGTDNTVIHEHWTWIMGNGESKYYMPTFNKDKDSLAADINGTFAGKDGKREEGRPYDDYVKYGINEEKGETKTKTDTAVYDADDDSTNQSALGLNDPAFVSTQTETHEVKQTQSGTVITMDQWDGEPGNYWVYDTDGWAYWANPIMPGEATGLLLTAIGTKKDPGTTSYYAINVVAQFASAWDWGTAENGTGFYTEKPPTDKAIKLLETIVEAVPTITVTNKNIATNEENVTAAYVGAQVQFDAKVMVGAEENKDAKITWMVVDESGESFTVPASGETLADSEGEETDATEGTETAITTIDETGLLTIAEDADGQIITVIAQSAGAVGRKSLYVGPYEGPQESIVIKEATGVTTVEPGVLQNLSFSAEKVLDGSSEGTLLPTDDVNWTLAIKDADNQEVISEVTKIDLTTGVLSINTDLEAGMVLTITAISATDKTALATYEITVEHKPTSIEISGKNYATAGFVEEIQLSAKGVYNYVTTGVNSDVTWSLDGSDKSIIDSSTGLLTVSASEEAGTTLIITATSTSAPDVTGTYTVSIVDGDTAQKITQAVADVNNAEEGKAVTIDDRNWYVVVKTEEKALLWMTDIESTFGTDGNGKGRFDGSSSQWEGSEVQTWLNNVFYNNLSTLKGMIVETDFKTRSTFGGTDFTESKNQKVFLFSEADIFGTQNSGATQPDDYTYYGARLTVITDEMKESSYPSWLRSPRQNISYVAILGRAGGFTNYLYDNTNAGVRPALWVSLQ